MEFALFSVARELEREGFKLLSELSTQTREESGWKMFLALAHQERDHMATIEREIEHRQARGEGMPEDVQQEAAEFRRRLLGAMEGAKSEP